MIAASTSMQPTPRQIGTASFPARRRLSVRVCSPGLSTDLPKIRPTPPARTMADSSVTPWGRTQAHQSE